MMVRKSNFSSTPKEKQWVGDHLSGNAGDSGSIPGLGDPLEKKMATHSSTLAWTIQWMKEPGGLQSMGSQSRTQLSDFTFFHLS